MLRMILWVSSIVVFIIKKLSGANITISGDPLPAGPILFLANHFTRFETFVVPYVLFNQHKRVARSLADDTVFVGWFGEYLRLVGSVSVKNEARDSIIVDDLLSGHADWIIYPEGHMVKNKKISFEAGEYCIDTAMRKGPVHTGAAVLALRAEILRQHLQEKSETERPLHIVPLSITYYPIRPGSSWLLKWLDKHFDLRGTRLFEELEIEINLLMASNMHLHFAKPIVAAEYIKRYQAQEERSINDDDFTDRLFAGQRKNLITFAMSQVYGNVQVNFDHLFILSLFTMPTFKVCPSYLKTLIYKNARGLRKIKGLNLHPDLKTDLFRLILDRKYQPFLSAIELAKLQQIVYQDSEGDYLFDRNLLEKDYDFNKIRVKNTLQVVLNEIRWQHDIVALAEYNATFKERELQIDNFDHMQQQEWDLFEDEYCSYHDHVPTPSDVGAPSIWFESKNSVGLVFCHGYMAAPAEARALAEYLFARGINIYLPRLRGHGTDPKALKEVRAEEWQLDFERAVTAMHQVCETVFVGGFSTGGLLALQHAAHHDVAGVIAINSALRLNNLKVSYIVPTLYVFNEMIAYLHAKGIKEWVENRSENPEINYDRHPLASIAQMEKVMTRVDKSLRNITDPVLVLQGDNDPVVNPKSAQLIYRRVKSRVKRLVMVPRENHNTLTSEGCDEVFESVHRFIGDVLQRDESGRDNTPA